MDGSPIMDKTPVDGLFFNGGWCYGGFKATPGCGFLLRASDRQGEPASRRGRLPARSLRDAAASSTKRASAHAQSALERRRQSANDKAWFMLIDCPYCGPRDLAEFAVNGEAVARPDGERRPRWRGDPRGLRRGRLSTRQSGWPHREYWLHAAGCGSWLVIERDTRTHRNPQGRGRARTPRRNHERRRLQAVRGRPRSTGPARSPSPSMASPTRVMPAIRWRRRCSPMASASSAARSNIIARAACFRPDTRSRTRSSSCAKARAASPMSRRRRSNSTTGSVASSQNRWPSLDFDVMALNGLVEAGFRRRLLLQDLHVAGLFLGEGLRAGHSSRGRPWPRQRARRSGLATSGRTPIAMC